MGSFLLVLLILGGVLFLLACVVAVIDAVKTRNDTPEQAAERARRIRP